MAGQFIPIIANQDYETFRRILDPHLPNTYEKWLDLVDQMTGDNISRGRASKPIELNPHEFSRYCEATGSSPNLHILKNFAHEKGIGHEY